jgi:macrolide transport system ATP-binding/permease protein
MFGRKRNREDFAAEIRAHLEIEADALREDGWSEDEAQRRARVEFGSVRGAEERFQTRGRAIWLGNLAGDAKFALRQLVRNPGFAMIAIAVLALGIGAGVAIFAFVDAALLEPLPYADPTRLMAVNESDVASPVWPLSFPDYIDWQRLNKSLSSLDIYQGSSYLLRSGSGAEPVRGERVSGGFFQTLGVRPILGRDFAPGENRLGGPNVLLLSYGAWLHRFGQRRDVVGQAVSLDNTAYVIVGILPREFSFAPGGNAEFWVPINTLSPHEHSRWFYNFFGVGRLRKGVTVSGAQAEMKGIAAQLEKQYPTPGRDESASVVPFVETVVGDVRPILLTLLGGAGLLLMIACVNVASLVLVRSESRRREVAVRGALGATPVRLVWQFVVEGLLLAALGDGLGILTADALMHLLGGMVPKDMAANMPFLDGVEMNLHVVLFAGAVAIGAALLLAGTAIVRLSFQKVADGLATDGRGVASMLWRRLGANLVVMELAIAVVLLAGAGLLGKSFYRLLHVKLGFDPNHLATLSVIAPDANYQSDEQILGLYGEIRRRIESLPGVESAGMTSMIPVECNCAVDRIELPPRPYHGEHNDVDERHVSPQYLATLKAPLIRGRFFNEMDAAGAPNVTVINEALARRFFSGENPLGQKIADTEGGRPTTWEIVGVVGDVREGPLDVPLWPAEYFPLGQIRDRSFSLVVRTSEDPAGLLPTLVTTLHRIDPNLGVSDEATMVSKIDGTQAALLHRFAAWLIGGFAAMALVLGVVGLYGVIAYSVSLRTREIGVRMALGAQRGSVYRLILQQAGGLTFAGLVVGLASAVAVAATIPKMLFGVAAWDAATLAAVAVVLGTAAMLASFVPARRAARVNPIEALRAE